MNTSNLVAIIASTTASMIVVGMVVIITSKDYGVRPVTPVPMAAAMAVAMSRATSKRKTLKVNRLEFCFMESLHNTASLRNLNFCAHSARLLRKLNHVLLWILSNDTGL